MGTRVVTEAARPAGRAGCDLECGGGGGGGGPSITILCLTIRSNSLSSLSVAGHGSVIDGSHFLHKKCEKGLIDHRLQHQCPDLV